MKLFRFYFRNISGIVIAGSPEQATDRAKLYLANHFVEDIDAYPMQVWPAYEDDDYEEAYPWALAIAY